MSATRKVDPRHKKTYKPRQATMSLWHAIATVASEYDVMTVRQLYYQVEMRGYVGKTEAEYKKVQRACLQMRLQGELSFDKIVDSSRERREVYQYSGMRQALEDLHQTYRRNYWLDQPVHVEVWCEKDALTSIINPVCVSYGIAFQALRGFESASFAYESAKDIKSIGKPARIYYFGDHDASGWWIVRNLEPTLREFGADVTVFHMGVTPEQVHDMGLPTRRAKRSDTRYRGFVQHFGSDSCTEVDAIAPDVLRDMVRSCILRNIDIDAWHRAQHAERLELETLESLQAAGFIPGHRYSVTEQAA
jgi:hypothetical protein